MGRMKGRQWLGLALALAGSQALAATSCPPEGWSRDDLQTLKAGDFKVQTDDRRARLALDLLDCLASPDPALRDSIAFEAWSTWLRADQLDVATRSAALEQLLPRIAPQAAAGDGFAAPFAALVLSEIARTDRIAPWMSPAARDRLLAAGAEYLASVHDYRGFDEREGWRHGVAHGADLMLQLALNPALDKAQLDRIFTAVARQVAPPGHAYVFGKPARLARPVLYGALRGLHSQADWDAWFESLTSPAPAPTWREAVATQSGLARRHDLRAFLLEIQVEIADDPRPALAAMRPAVQAALKRVP